MEGIISTLLFIISLGVLVFIHELGHFTMAKAFGVYVKEFAIGFGPVLAQFKKGETTYSIRALPLGGFVSMFGEETSIEGMDIPQSRSLQGISKPKRAIVMSAGIILNLVLAFVLFFFSNWGFTQRTLTNQMVIDDGSFAAQAGIQTSEVLYFAPLLDGSIAVDTPEGEATYSIVLSPFSSYEDTLSTLIRYEKTVDGVKVYYTPSNIDDFVSFSLPVRTYSSQTEFIERDVFIRLDAIAVSDGFAFPELGISFFVFMQDYDFNQALVKAGQDWTRGVTLIVDTVIGLFRGENLDQVGGIVAIFSTSSSVLSNLGLGTYIFLWGLISVNLAVFNLLPFPGLDGWHLLVITLEGIFRKEIPSRVKNILSLIGFMILMSLMLFLIIKDVLALIVGV
jgi:regulator of sigma E protease